MNILLPEINKSHKSKLRLLCKFNSQPTSPDRTLYTRQTPIPLYSQNYSRIQSLTPNPLRSYKPNSFYDKNRKSKQLLNYKEKKKQLESLVSQRESRTNLKHRLQDEYGVLFKTREVLYYPEDKLVDIAKKIHDHKLKEKSSQKLQKAWKIYNIRKELKISKLKLNHCARVIQQAWMNYRRRLAIKKLHTERQLAAIKIQKVFRGYRVRKILWKQRHENNYQEMLRYFDEIKRKNQIAAVCIISRSYQAYKLRREIAHRVQNAQTIKTMIAKKVDKSFQTGRKYHHLNIKSSRSTRDMQESIYRPVVSSMKHRRAISTQESIEGKNLPTKLKRLSRF